MPEGHWGGRNVKYRPKMAFSDVSFFDFFLRKKSTFLSKATERPPEAYEMPALEFDPKCPKGIGGVEMSNTVQKWHFRTFHFLIFSFGKNQLFCLRPLKGHRRRMKCQHCHQASGMSARYTTRLFGQCVTTVYLPVVLSDHTASLLLGVRGLSVYNKC